MASDILPHEKEVRARVLEVNEYLQAEAARIRNELGIPEGGFTSPGDAIKWRLSHCKEHQASIATAGGPYRSDDEGESWELVDNGLQRHYTLHISAALDNADVVLVSVSSNAGRQNPQFYRSSNGAAKWNLIESVGSDDDMVVAIDWDPADPRRVYAGTEGGSIFRSEDQGESWEPLAIRMPAIAVSAMVVAPA